MKPPQPTVEDARRLYFEERIKGKSTEKNDLQRLNRALEHLLAITKGNIDLDMLKREHARDYRDQRLKSGVSPTTVRREINTLKAVFNLAKKELSLKDFSNPFEGIEIKNSASKASDRRGFTEDELTATREQIFSLKNSELHIIWTLLETTGARLGEIAGLKRADVILEEETPFIIIRPNELRNLKNQSSERFVPLIGEALNAIKLALEAAGDRDFLFLKYASQEKRGADKLSQTLNKYIRRVVEDKKVTTHSLRHTLKNRLRAAGIAEELQRLLLGHSGDSVAAIYGSNRAYLANLKDALEKAQNTVLPDYMVKG